jgi:hypothetical protein
MSGNWLHRVKHVTPGEPVQAGVVGRPDRALEDRTDYLKDRLDAAEIGRALFDADATIAPDVLPGQPVFWNYATQRYEKALAAVEVDAATQALVVQPSSDCVGICYRKRAENQGDIVLRGIVALPGLVNAIGEEIAPGRYYLSASEPGKLTQQRPAVSVYVCYVQGPKDNCSDVPNVVVMPHVKDFIDEHTHYRFDLYCRPAGTNSIAVENGKQVHYVTSPNTNLPGWLPADHPIFDERAPEGAVFGYNFAEHTALSRVWPPLPLQSVALLWDKGAEYVGATEIPLGRSGLAICDANGIWWMSRCYGDVPWPATYTTAPTDVPDTAVSECPRDEAMRLAVVFLRMLIGNDRRVVTSLAPQTNSPIQVLNCDDLPATTGDLKLNLQLQVAEDEAFGGQAFKDVVNDHQLKAGWLAEGVVVHEQAQVAINSTHARPLTTLEKDYLGLSVNDAILLHQGIVNLTFDNPFVDREILPQIIRLSDTVERLYSDIPYLGFPPSQASLLRIRLNVPDSYLGDNIAMRIRVRLFGQGAAGQTLPPLYMTYRRISRPSSSGIVLPTTDTSLTFNTVTTINPYTLIERESEAFDVAAGDVVLITIGRNAGDTYPAEVGVIRIAGILFKPAVA